MIVSERALSGRTGGQSSGAQRAVSASTAPNISLNHWVASGWHIVRPGAQSFPKEGLHKSAADVLGR